MLKDKFYSVIPKIYTHLQNVLPNRHGWSVSPIWPNLFGSPIRFYSLTNTKTETQCEFRLFLSCRRVPAQILYSIYIIMHNIYIWRLNFHISG